MEPIHGHACAAGDIPGGKEILLNPDEFFVLNHDYLLSWEGDFNTHAELFAQHLQACGFSSPVLVAAAIGSIAVLLETFWAQIECQPLEAAVARARLWRRRVVAYSMEIATSELDAVPAEPKQ